MRVHAVAHLGPLESSQSQGNRVRQLVALQQMSEVQHGRLRMVSRPSSRPANVRIEQMA